MQGLCAFLLAALLAGCASGGGQGVVDNGSTMLSKAHGDDAKIRVKLGIQYLRNKNYGEASRILREAMERYPDLPGPISAMALVYERVDDPRGAASAFQRAVELDPHDAAIRNNYANFLCRQGYYAQAFEQFEAGFRDRLYADPAQLHINAGRCALRMPDLGRAEIEFRKALALAPDDPEALREMAGISVTLRRYRLGLTYLDRLASLGELSPASLWLGVQLSRGAKDQDRELLFARDLSLKYPHSPEAQWLLR